MIITDDLLNKKINELSGGQKSKVVFARLLYFMPEVILLDEPTNHLNLETQKIIAETFKDFKGTVLVVSHNPEFVDNLDIERVLVLPSGQLDFYNRKMVEYYHQVNTEKFKEI